MSDTTDTEITASIGKAELTAPSVQIGGGFQLVPRDLREAVDIAKLMSKAHIVIPRPLQENAGACLAVAMQAWRWGMDPFAVAQKTYIVESKVKDPRGNDTGEKDYKIAYEAQLIIAVVNTRAGLVRRPEIYFEGENGDRRCTIVGEFSDGAVQTYISPKIRDIQPKRSPLWKNDPDQQLSYYSIRAFARRHCPEVILGVYDREELDEADTGPDRPRIGEALNGEQDKAEGFVSADVEGEVAQITDARENKPLTDDDVKELQSVLGEALAAAELDDPDTPEALKRSKEEPGQVA